MSALIPSYPAEAAGKIVMGLYFAAAVALVVLTKRRLGYAAGAVE
jgi:hypothetical protein